MLYFFFVSFVPNYFASLLNSVYHYVAGNSGTFNAYLYLLVLNNTYVMSPFVDMLESSLNICIIMRIIRTFLAYLMFFFLKNTSYGPQFHSDRGCLYKINTPISAVYVSNGSLRIPSFFCLDNCII